MCLHSTPLSRTEWVWWPAEILVTVWFQVSGSLPTVASCLKCRQELGWPSRSSRWYKSLLLGAVFRFFNCFTGISGWTYTMHRMNDVSCTYTTQKNKQKKDFKKAMRIVWTHLHDKSFDAYVKSDMCYIVPPGVLAPMGQVRSDDLILKYLNSMLVHLQSVLHTLRSQTLVEKK